jgi:hypothetical protein
MIPAPPRPRLPDDDVLGHPRHLYEHAVLHILVGVVAEQWRLLFAFVELLPREIPPPIHDGCRWGPRLKKCNGRVFADHVPLSASAALAWYESARQGQVVRPERDGSVLVADDHRATICQPLGWSEEPIWPRYVLADAEHRLPFLSRWHVTPRMHHLMPLATNWDYSPEEAAELDGFVESEVGFRITGWTQLAESIHLVVPNPYYRRYREELVSAPAPAVESIHVSVEPRNGVELPTLEVELVEHRPTGRSAALRVPLDVHARTVPMGPAIHEMSATVQLASGGLLETSPRASWLRGLHTSMNPVFGSRQVYAIDAQGRSDTYHVNILHGDLSKQEKPEPVTAIGQLIALMNDASIKDTASKLQQHWSGHNRDTVSDFVRSLIRPARDQVLIADPYLGPAEIKQYALAVGLAGVRMRLLTTRTALAKESPVAQALPGEIIRWRAMDPSLGTIEVKVMTADKLHDRFLRVDNRLYALGNSLNSLGVKGSLFMRVPDPTPIFDKLDQIWDLHETKALADCVRSLQEDGWGKEPIRNNLITTRAVVAVRSCSSIRRETLL